MPAYALAHLYETSNHPEVFEYIERIQSTMDPYGGRFVVHGAMPEVIEGEWPGTLVIIEFPDREQARRWYESAAYQEILHMRTDHIPGAAILVDGVGPNYDAVVTAAKLRALADAG